MIFPLAQALAQGSNSERGRGKWCCSEFSSKDSLVSGVDSGLGVLEASIFIGFLEVAGWEPMVVKGVVISKVIELLCELLPFRILIYSAIVSVVVGQGGWLGCDEIDAGKVDASLNAHGS